MPAVFTSSWSTFWTAVAAVGTIVAAIGAIVAATVAIMTMRGQTKQEQTALWRSLYEEFWYKLRRDRIACGTFYGAHGGPRVTETPFLVVMDFFETLAYLVRHQRIDVDLARESLSFYFAGYFIATKDFLAQLRDKRDPTLYENVFELAQTWAKDPLLTTDVEIAEFFSDEHGLDLGNRLSSSPSSGDEL